MPDQLTNYITARAQALGLDPRAVLAVAGQEGLSGRIGDQGTSFGPFQLHYGGAYPSSAPQATPAASQAWAMSPAGINYALGQMQSVAGGLTGRPAVNAIVNQFERPADPASEAANAWATYGGPAPPSAALGQPGPSMVAGTRQPSSLPSSSLPGAVPSTNLAMGVLGGLGSNNLLGGTALSPLGMNPIGGMLGGGLLGSLVTGALAQQAVPSSSVPLGGKAQGTKTITTTGGMAPSTAKTPTGLDPIGSNDLTSVGGQHPTEGLPGFPAHDYFAPAGSPVVAPVTGTIDKLSGNNPADGPTEGPHGPFGWSAYVQGSNGRTYYLTHMGSRDVQVGEPVKAGQVIGTVGNYAKYGTPSHIHMGISAPGVQVS